MSTEVFNRFIGYFKLSGKERSDGLDSSYFNGMTDEEKLEAFEILKEKMLNGSEEAIHGLKLISIKKAFPELKRQYDYFKKSDRANLQLLPLAYHLYSYNADVKYQADMANFLSYKDKYVRLAALSYLEQTEPSILKTSVMEKVVVGESDKVVLYAAVEQLLEGFGIIEDDPNTGSVFDKKIDRFIDEDTDVRKAAIKWLKDNYAPKLSV